MTDEEFIHSIKEAIHNADMAARPYIVVCNPVNKSQLNEAVGDMCIIKATNIIEQNKCYFITRAEWERLVEDDSSL